MLQSAGKISREQAEQKAISEYRAYELKTLSPIEQEYLATLKALEKISHSRADSSPPKEYQYYNSG